MRYILLILLNVVTGCALAYSQPDSASGGRKVVGRVEVSGNRVTKRSVILRELSIHEGSLVNVDSISALVTQNKLRLFNLQLFNEVEQQILPGTGDTVYWQILVKERWYVIPTALLQFADRNINTWWVDQNHDLDRVSAGLTLTNRNFRGNLEALAVTVQAGYTKKLGLSYMLPYLNKDQTNGIGVIASVAQSNQAYYTTAGNKLIFAGDYKGPVIWRQAEGGLSYIYRPGYAKRHIFQASYKYAHVADTLLQLNRDYYADSSTTARFLELYYRYEYNGVDNWNYSLRGEKLVTTLVVRKGFEGLNFQSYANVEAGVFRNPLPHWYVSAIARGRLMFPQPQPYYFRNGLGTATDYVRGYEYYVTDGYNYGLLRLNLKREIFNNTYSLPVKYFTAIPVRVYPKLFFDVGYINSPLKGTNTLENTLMYSFGAGIDLVTFYDMKVRLEFARNHLGQNGVYLHFNSE
jgi:outer membrane protein assembly factor BamA